MAARAPGASAEIAGATLDHDADLARARDCAGLRDRHFRPSRAKLADHDPRDRLRERLDELELRRTDEFEHALGEPLVVERCLDLVDAGRSLRVRSDLEIDAHDLLDPAFPFPEPDDRLDP